MNDPNEKTVLAELYDAVGKPELRTLILVVEAHCALASAMVERDEALASNERLREALKPFAIAANNLDMLLGAHRDFEAWHPYWGQQGGEEGPRGTITVGDLRRTRAALEETT